MQLYLKGYILCLTPLVQHNFAQNNISLWYAQRLSGRVNNEQLATNKEQRTINTIYNNSRFRAKLVTVRLAVVTHITLATFCARMMRPTIAELAFNPALARTTIAIGLAAHKTIPLLFGCRVSWRHDVRRLFSYRDPLSSRSSSSGHERQLTRSPWLCSPRLLSSLPAICYTERMSIQNL